MFCYFIVFGLLLSTPIYSQGILKDDLGVESTGFIRGDVVKKAVSVRRHLTQDNPTEIISMKTDEPPPNAAFECSKYLALGLCKDLGEQYYQQSCGTCECLDVPVPGAECSTIVSGGQCEDDAIKGIFCAKSCGFCGDSSRIISFDQGGCSSATNLQCDLDALLAFKNSLTAGSSILSSWSGSNPCDWIYVACSNLDGQNRVSQLQLNFINTYDVGKMAGQIVPDFSKMRYLREININNQEDLKGKLYTQFSVLDKLEQFSIFGTGISGTLPSEFSTMSNLRDFSTSFNSLRGTLPPEYSTFKELHQFRQGANQISNTLPKVYSVWENMNNFDISENQLSGSLPPEYSSFIFIDLFYVHDNSLIGTLPLQYSTFEDVTKFAVSKNDGLTGTLPLEYSTMRKIELFYTRNTGLVSQIPGEWSVFSSSADINV